MTEKECEAWAKEKEHEIWLREAWAKQKEHEIWLHVLRDRESGARPRIHEILLEAEERGYRRGFHEAFNGSVLRELLLNPEDATDGT
jgi:hypothetical protein